MRTQLLRLVLVLACLALPGGLARAADPMFGSRAIFGDGPGFANDFFTFESFLPLVDTNTDMTFFNARGVWDYEETLLGSNFGLGYRMYQPKSDRMFGFNAYYDLRDTDFDFYHQLGMGFETVGPNWDFRSNFYVPVKSDDELIGQVFTDPFVQGNNIVVGRTDFIQSALPGFDMEVGLALPVPFDAKLYGGWYGYEEADHDTEFGWKARLQTQLTDNIAASVGVADDEIFGTTVNFGLAWYWRGYLPRLGYEGNLAGRGTAYNRLTTPVERNYWIAVDDRAVEATEALTQLVSGDGGETFTRIPITIRFIDNGAVGSTDLGTFEEPFTSLVSAQTLSNPNDILFVTGIPFDTTNMDTGILLADGQRLLADGHRHFVSTVERGDILLPVFDPAAIGQTLTNVEGGPIVELANTNEVSGFRIIDSPVSAIVGIGVIGEDFSDVTPFTNQRGININRNEIIDENVAGNIGSGILLVSVSGIVNIGVPDPRDTAGLVPDWGNEIAGHADHGISQSFVALDGFVETRTTIQNNSIHDNGTLGAGGVANGNGINFAAIDVDDAADFGTPALLRIDNNRIFDNALHGIGFFTTGNDADVLQPVLIVEITNNTINDNGTVFADNTQGDGINVLALNQATISTLLIDRNIIGRDVVAMSGEGNASDGIDITLTGAGNDRARADIQITNNVISSNGPPPFVDDVEGDGINISVNGNAEIDELFISRNIIGFDSSDPGSRGNSRSGIDITASGDEIEDAFIRAFIEDNIILENGTFVGPVIINPEGSGITITGVIEDDAAPPIEFTISRNVISRNQLHGIDIENSLETDMLVTITDGNIIENNGSRVPDGTPFGSGIDVLSDGTNRLDLIIGSSVALGTPGNTSINSNLVDGIALTLADETEVEAVINDNLEIRFNGSTDLLTFEQVGSAMTVVTTGLSFLDMEVRRNTLSDNTFYGIFHSFNDESEVRGAITDNNIQRNGTRNPFGASFGDGLFFGISGEANVDFANPLLDDAIRNNLITDSEWSGVHILASNEGLADFDILNNTFQRNGNPNAIDPVDFHQNGITIQLSGDVIFNPITLAQRPGIRGNLIETSGFHGISIEAGSSFDRFDITNNVIRNNGEDGINYESSEFVGVGVGNILEIRNNVLSGNVDDGTQIILSDVAGLDAGVTENLFQNNGDFGFDAQVLFSGGGTANLCLQFLANAAPIPNAGPADYRFFRTGNPGVPPPDTAFLFENPFFNEAPPFPLFTNFTNQPGTFIIIGADDVPLGFCGFGVFPGPF